MALKQTITQLRELLTQVSSDLEKSEGGNKAASQRVRTGTIKLEKVAKNFRKESIKNDKSTKGTKKSGTKKAAGPKKAAKKTTAKKAAPAKKTVKKAAPKKKAATHKTSAHAKALSLKKRKQTAKLPSRRKSAR